MLIEGYLALSEYSDDLPVGERTPATMTTSGRGVMIDLADDSRRIAVTVPSGVPGWRLGFFRGDDDVALFLSPWFNADRGDSYTIDLPPVGQPVWVLQWLQ